MSTETSTLHAVDVWYTNLDLGERDLKAKALIEVWIQSVLFN